jgi:hypothetical protein
MVSCWLVGAEKESFGSSRPGKKNEPTRFFSLARHGGRMRARETRRRAFSAFRR